MSGIVQGLIASFKTAAVTATDSAWKYVTALLNTSSTNGAQNNTFLDSSTNAFTITRNGTPTQGTFTPFAPSNESWSGYFNGSSYLTSASNAGFQFGTGNFTIEFWINASASGTYNQVIGTLTSAADDGTWRVGNRYNSSNILFFARGNGTGFEEVQYSVNVNDGNWHHVACVRTSGVIAMYVDGVAQTVSSGSASISGTCSSSNSLWIGYNGRDTSYITGYLSNSRIVKGVAVYTGNFTPPTSPLTATSGGTVPPSGTQCSLLTCASNRFVDTGGLATPNTITLSGTPSIQRFQPFLSSAPYATSTVGGSGYFAGSSDYLSLSNVAALQPGTSTTAFSAECWFFSPTGTTATNTALFGNFKVISYPGSCDGFDVIFNSNTAVALRWGYPSYTDSGSLTVVQGQWNHIAVCRNTSGSMSVFINGTRAYNTSSNTTITTATASSFWVGWAGSLSGTTINPFAGYISNFRMVKGSTPYDPTQTTITVPTSPLTAITNTSLLVSATNAGIYDSAMMGDFQTVGDAQVSTTQAKWGTTSMKFDGTGDYLKAPYSKNYVFSGNFTIEFWIYYTAHGNYTGVVCCVNDNTSVGPTAGWILGFYSTTDKFTFQIPGVDIVTTNTIPSSQWVHHAVVRNGSTITHYTNGVANGSGSSSSVIDSATYPLYVAAARDLATFMTGYIDDLRISKYARYTTNFTPPTAAFPTQGQ